MCETSVGHIIENNAKVPQFGVAGFPPNYFESDLRRKRENVFLWLKQLHLDWIELQCTRGVRMKLEQAHLYRRLAEQYGIGISIHGPYFIALASGDRDVVSRSRKRVLDCFKLASELQSHRIIFHPGYFPGNSEYDRKEAVHQIICELNALRHDVSKGVYIYPETAGKNSQIGSLDEIMEICEQVEFARPCIDLAHIHAFTHGTLWDTQDISNVFNRIHQRLGPEYMNDIHIHMYPVDFTSRGERKHKAFDDRIEESEQQSLFDPGGQRDRFYPQVEHFISAIIQARLHPVVICEAYNTQDIGATLMKDLYFSTIIGQ